MKILNVYYNTDGKETLLREISALVEAMKYFKLRESKLIVAEGESRKICEQNFTIHIEPFYQWTLHHLM